MISLTVYNIDSHPVKILLEKLILFKSVWDHFLRSFYQYYLCQKSYVAKNIILSTLFLITSNVNEINNL